MTERYRNFKDSGEGKQQAVPSLWVWAGRIIGSLWRRASGRSPYRSRLQLGWKVVDGSVSRHSVGISQTARTEHLAILGKTGTGKSSLLRWLAAQDIVGGHGFVFFDLHGDATPYLVRRVALEESRLGRDLSARLIVIDPADPEWSVGLNILENRASSDAFVQIAEFTELLKHRWRLESLGARTEEALRNALLLLAENGLTLLELGPLLENASFRASCAARARNEETRRYFELRYDVLSEAMQAVVREPILNKTSFFSADPHFRHLVGQSRSTFSLRSAMEDGSWIVLNLHKGRLGEEAMTLGSLFLSLVKHALFSREHPRLFTLYCDEIQNLVAYDSGLDTILSEARKFGVSVVSANQLLDQYSAKMRAAILGVGTQIFFRLAALDAQQIGNALGGGRPLTELLKNLEKRHMVVKSGSEPWEHVCVPRLDDPRVNSASLYDRSRARWARRRSDVEREIAERHRQLIRDDASLKDWE